MSSFFFAFFAQVTDLLAVLQGLLLDDTLLTFSAESFDSFQRVKHLSAKALSLITGYVLAR